MSCPECVDYKVECGRLRDRVMLLNLRQLATMAYADAMRDAFSAMVSFPAMPLAFYREAQKHLATVQAALDRLKGHGGEPFA